jgi:hypothetical protein
VEATDFVQMTYESMVVSFTNLSVNDSTIQGADLTLSTPTNITGLSAPIEAGSPSGSAGTEAQLEQAPSTEADATSIVSGSRCVMPGSS